MQLPVLTYVCWVTDGLTFPERAVVRQLGGSPALRLIAGGARVSKGLKRDQAGVLAVKQSRVEPLRTEQLRVEQLPVVGDSQQPHIDDGLCALLGVPEVTKRVHQDAARHLAMRNLRALYMRERELQDVPAISSGGAELMEELIVSELRRELLEEAHVAQMATMMDMNIFWGEFLNEYVCSGLGQELLDRIGYRACGLVEDNNAARVYAGVTRRSW